MILVTAANGNQGRTLLPKLLAAGHEVRANVRSEASAVALRAAGVTDVVVGDLADPEILARSVRDVEKIYHVGPALSPTERETGFALIDAARAAGVRHFVMSSVLHAITTDLVQHEVKRDIEEHLLSSGLTFTILQPTNYMLAHRLTPAFERGVFELSWSLDRLQSLVDPNDVTDVAALVLGDTDRHAFATYELASAGRYSAHDIGGIIAAVVGHPIDVVEIDAETFATRMGDAGEYQRRAMDAISARYSSHDFVGNPNVLTWLLGRAPTSFEEWVRRHDEAYRNSSSR
ncbi:nucleoside-diphosphate sugar epimerase [Frondihabitans sp. PAMC 28766]|uniref:NmrA family NAD(P)-binding protein n=1 Tax=Frondihabitans sp. PAMC 28766 TaxID=1795630 RepID=UPI00078BB55B|nr:NmrA family NAD(P)-binding protein [Frondihabitans sp. PAMC 28766]AMM18949.1 nucleoside-diphosphate sugar epimerase [Frondihabitans sp. PAMC 28766]